MKLRFILSEDVDIQKHQAQLDAVSKRTDISQEDLINYLNDMDPSGNYTRWILKQIKFQNIRVPEDNHRVAEALQQFDQNKQRLEVKDIMQYKRVSDLEDALEPVLGTGSKRTKALQYNPMALPGVEKLAEDGPFVLYHITNANSLAELGEGTKLCTRKSYPNCQAAYYLKHKGPIYIITKDNKLFVQVATKSEIKDPKNNNVSAGILSLDIVKHVPYLAYEYTKSKDDRVLELEPIIMKDPEYACKYAINHKSRWPKAEPIIKESPHWACYYAREVIKGPWPEAEPIIKTDPQWAYVYARDILKRSWPEAEPYIMKDAEWAFEYASDILRRRWPEAEPYIMRDAEYLNKYLNDMVKGRWPEAEPYIKEIPSLAYPYALERLHRRWPEAEPAILNSSYLYLYLTHIIDGPWPEAEPIIMKKPKAAYKYARKYKPNGWPEAEPYIKQNPKIWEKYTKYLERSRRKYRPR